MTIIIEEDIDTEWRNWIKSTFIPKISDTSLFISHRILKVLSSPNEGITYCIQFVAESAAQYDQFVSNHALEIMELHTEKFKNRCVSFSTLMEYVE
ncbi:hypothetical protein ADIARSV_1698 [Arcticibacter svalbardensis MN12-7]|uniref:DUF4286 domain-containing protein n=1 Tax=Arcticibacter svalbardensis MN12-7 TaxID=1150600 RepID=R9GUN2_9SPHI|nr:DUF4286 family protein [Arcticibacter svalbardensis]EOR95210.1 hypothetical protein ADIARSV_1698 [Arcticibacter svalbardensis MN12-7]